MLFTRFNAKQSQQRTTTNERTSEGAREAEHGLVGER